MPERIRMSRQRPWRAEHPDAVVVARPGPWGNPYRVVRVGKTTWHVQHGSWLQGTFHSRTGAEARGEAVRAFRLMIEHDRAPWPLDMVRRELAGRDLACWCPLDQPCHADVLLELANRRLHSQQSGARS